MADNRFFASQHMRVSKEEYEKEYLPLFQRDIVKLLQLQPGVYSTVSFQEVNSRCYKCAGNELSLRLLTDVRQTITDYFGETYADIITQDSVQFLTAFNEMTKQFLYSVQHVATAFTYLNKSYVEDALQENLLGLLYQDFNQYITKTHLPRLSESLAFVRLPFAIDPAIVSNVVWTLYMLDNDYVGIAPEVFALHVPNLSPSMREEDIPAYIAETRQLQDQLAVEGYSPTSRPSAKRALEMEVPTDASHNICL